MPDTATHGVLIAFVVSAGAVSAIVGAGGARMTTRRYRLAWTDPGKLTDPPCFRHAVAALTRVMAFLAVAWAVLLIVPASPWWRTGIGSSVVLCGAGVIASAAVYLQLRRAWSVVGASIACALMTVGACGLVRCLLGSAAHATDHYVALMFGATAMAALWSWLADVWEQQLDKAYAWTVAGRLIQLNRYFAAGNAAAAVAAGFAATRTVSTWGVVGHVVLLVVVVGCWRRFRGVEFVFLLIAAIVSMLAFLVTPAPSS